MFLVRTCNNNINKVSDYNGLLLTIDYLQCIPDTNNLLKYTRITMHIKIPLVYILQ